MQAAPRRSRPATAESSKPCGSSSAHPFGAPCATAAFLLPAVLVVVFAPDPSTSLRVRRVKFNFDQRINQTKMLRDCVDLLGAIPGAFCRVAELVHLGTQPAC